jgi:AcrR family transcriptional regulator
MNRTFLASSLPTDYGLGRHPSRQDTSRWVRTASSWHRSGQTSLSLKTGLSCIRDRPVLSICYACYVAIQAASESRTSRTTRERILDTAYELFSRRGIRAVGIDEVIAQADVAKATLYRHFPSKNDLVLAFLEQREQLWTNAWVEPEARRRGKTAEQQLLAIFDLFDEWFRKDDFEGCSFINVLLEFGGGQHEPLGRASATHLENIRSIVRTLAEEAGLRDPASFALSWHILMKGAIVQAGEGDHDAAKRAQTMGRLLIDQHRPPSSKRARPRNPKPRDDGPSRTPTRR